MLDASQSGCVNHPTKPAVLRCKQCGVGVCKQCIIPGPVGRYCSETCKQQHEEFMRKSQAAEQKVKNKHPIRWGRLLRKLVIIVGIIVGLGVLGSVVNIPILSGVVFKIRMVLGF